MIISAWHRFWYFHRDQVNQMNEPNKGFGIRGRVGRWVSATEPDGTRL